MKGLRFSDNDTLDVRLAPLLPELDKLWWVWPSWRTNFQWGWWEKNEAYLDQYWFCSKDTWDVWRPGFFSFIAPYLEPDEWSYFIGFEAEEARAENIFHEIMSHRFLEQELFQRTSLYTLFMVDVTSNWFEFYSHNPQWMEALAQHHAHVREIDSDHWIEYQREQSRRLEELHRRKPTNQ